MVDLNAKLHWQPDIIYNSVINSVVNKANNPKTKAKARRRKAKAKNLGLKAKDFSRKAKDLFYMITKTEVVPYSLLSVTS